jgi:hypothetical protein
MLKTIWFVVALFWGIGAFGQGSLVLTEAVGALAHELKTDDIAPVWMQAEDEWVVGFARDNKLDRRQELGYWQLYGEVNDFMLSTSRRGFAGIGRRSSGRDYRFFSGYLCWAPKKPFRRLAYIHNHHEIKVIEAKDLEHPDTLMTLEFQVNNLYLDWSAADQLAFVSELSGDGDIYVANVPQAPIPGRIKGKDLGRYIKRLTKSSIHDGQPAWSPDGKRLAYTAKPGELTQDIYIVDDVGAALTAGGIESGRRLTSFPSAEANPSWSPDGSMLAFYRIEGGEKESVELWVVKMDGSGGKKIGEKIKRPLWGKPSWLHQAETGRGPQLIYVVLETGGSRMLITDVESGESRQVLIDARVISDVTAAAGKQPYIAFSAQDADRRKRIFVKKLLLTGVEGAGGDDW